MSLKKQLLKKTTSKSGMDNIKKEEKEQRLKRQKLKKIQQALGIKRFGSVHLLQYPNDLKNLVNYLNEKDFNFGKEEKRDVVQKVVE